MIANSHAWAALILPRKHGKPLDYLRDAGFDNVSFDLIAGLPGQTLDGWKRNLDEALGLRPEHLSFYLLEVHEGTPLAEHIRRGDATAA